MRVDRRRDRLAVSWADGPSGELPYIWLRDNCLCADCRHPDAWERTFDTVELDLDIRPATVDVGDDLTLTWQDGHRTVLSSAWLRAHLPGSPGTGWLEPQPVLWTAAGLGEASPEVRFTDIQADGDALLGWLRLIRDYGVAFVRGVPTRVGAVLDLAERIAFVQETNFGHSFQVISTPDPDNLAFTAARLTPHTDVPNRRALPGLQLLHCIEFQARGGDSTLVDGFLAAARLQEADPDAHELLASTPVAYRFQDARHDLGNRSPVIALDGHGRLTEIRFHPALLAPLDIDPDLMRPYYRALVAFGRILRDPDLEFRFTMRPGDCQVFDNRRILHGRAAFDPSSGRRHLEGCYVDRDDFLSRLRVLERAGADFRMR